MISVLFFALRFSIYAMYERKKVRFMGVKTSWSAATRATTVEVFPASLTRDCRNLYHWVAAGPNTAGGGRQLGYRDKEKRQLRRTSAVEDHAAGSFPIVVLEAALFDYLLSCDIAGAEENLPSLPLCKCFRVSKIRSNGLGIGEWTTAGLTYGSGDDLGKERALRELRLIPVAMSVLSNLQ
jgi:hypothetical protein